MRIAVLASHGGSLLQAVMDACDSGTIAARVVLAVSNNSNSGAMQRARSAGIPALHLSTSTHANPDDLDRAMCDALRQGEADLVLLAGYMKRLGPLTLAHFRRRIVNTHPALLPRYGGRGFYGSRVHAAVLEAGDTESGASIHFVEGDYDTGPLIAQRRVPVLPDDDVQSLETRVKETERTLLIDTLADLAADHARRSVTVRPLLWADVDAYRRIRLQALELLPTAFESSFETERRAPITKYRERLSGNPENVVFGAFSGEELIGIACLVREAALKRRHIASVVSMYVDATHRRRSVARRLLEEIVSHARRLGGIDQLELGVTASNAAARNLYLSLGFRSWGIQRAAIRVDGVDYDEEHMVLRLGSPSP